MKAVYSVGGLRDTKKDISQMRIAKEAGFDGVDYILTLRDLIKTPSILPLVKKYQIPVLSLHVPIILVAHTPSLAYRLIFRQTTFFPQCKAVNFHLSGTRNYLTWSATDSKNIIALGKKYRQLVAFESNPKMYGIHHLFPKVTYDAESFGQYCVANNLPINMDLSHIATCNYDINKFYLKYQKHITMIHMSDYRKKDKEQHLPFGMGDLPIVDLLKNLKKTNFKGHIVFEVVHFPKNFSLEEKITAVKESLQLFRTHTTSI